MPKPTDKMNYGFERNNLDREACAQLPENEQLQHVIAAIRAKFDKTNSL